MSEDIHWQKYASRFKTYPAKLEPIDTPVGMIVCIPVFAEPNLLLTLESLHNCEIPDARIEVLILFNEHEKMTLNERILHNQVWKDCLQWIDQVQMPGLQFKPLYIDKVPDSRGGVGWARKLVLDEAARRLHQDGILICLDADCTVDSNYLKEVYDFFIQHPSCDAVSIYFEHNLEGLDPAVHQAIVQYELHLRYLVHATKWTGHPFAFQTVGSCMAVKRKSYLEHGGMNTRQAGEDFYFLQKFIEVDSLYEIKETTVYPSPRVSGRVPFGTGRAMKQLLNESALWMTTNMEVFHHIRPLFNNLEKLRQISIAPIMKEPHEILKQIPDLSDPLITFLGTIDFLEECRRIGKQTTSLQTFTRRFFRFFNAFRMIRYSHYIRDHFFPDVPVLEAIKELSKDLNLPVPENQNATGYLHLYRQLDKEII